jgi:hypothetical protein
VGMAVNLVVQSHYHGEERGFTRFDEAAALARRRANEDGVPARVLLELVEYFPDGTEYLGGE